jgi:glutathionylspermidine synthase
MHRQAIIPRENWKTKVEELGFSYHTLNGEVYWDESAYYSFSYKEIDVLEKASNKLHRMCLKAVDYVIRENLFARFCIPENYITQIKKSWQGETASIYGRFDLSWNGDLNTPPKMLEYNADTPTSLLEAGVVQWFWLKEFHDSYDQFNSIHEKLIAWWKQIKPSLKNKDLYFSCLDEFPEDYVNMTYLQDAAQQAGIHSEFISIHDIGWDGKSFTDLNEQKIHTIFKLYPWEWIMHEEFGPHVISSDTLWIEPSWKMILSNKAILPILWKLFPDHPNLLECYFDTPGPMIDYVKKPLLSREGANVTLVEGGKVVQETDGEYGDEGFVFQQLHKLPSFDGNYPVIGSWIIGGKSAGIGIRESRSPITDNFSRFVPHAILP